MKRLGVRFAFAAIVAVVGTIAHAQTAPPVTSGLDAPAVVRPGFPPLIPGAPAPKSAAPQDARPVPADPAPLAAPRPTASAAAVVALDGGGALAGYINRAPALRKAMQLRSDPRFERLSNPTKNDLLQEYGVLLFSKAVPSRDSLTDEVRPLDKERDEFVAEQFRLRQETPDVEVAQIDYEYRVSEYRKVVDPYNAERAANDQAIARHNQAVAAFDVDMDAHKKAVDAHNAEVAQYDAQCAGKTLPEPQYRRCVSWQATLTGRQAALTQQAAALTVRADVLNQAMASLNQKKAELDSRLRTLNQRHDELSATGKALDARKKKLAADLKRRDDWQLTLDQKWDFAKRRIEAWIADLERFNARAEKALEGK